MFSFFEYIYQVISGVIHWYVGIIVHTLFWLISKPCERPTTLKHHIDSVEKRTNLRVAVIGGGISGISAMKSCLEEGIVPVCFVLDDDIGGFWKFSDVDASVYKSTHIDTDRDLSCYTDLPYYPSQGMILHNTEVYKYLRRNVDEYELDQYIQYRTRVTNVSRDTAVNACGTQRWLVDYDVLDDDQNVQSSHSTVFDGVMVCTGRHGTSGYVPHFDGLDQFKGAHFHSSHYTSPNALRGKRVCVVGNGNSGIDIVSEVSKVTDMCYFVVRTGAWIIKAGKKFYTGEVHDRVTANLIGRLPWWWASHILETFSDWLNLKNTQKILDDAGMKPRHRLLQQHTLVTGLCDPDNTLHDQITNGSITVVNGIRNFTERGVVFVGGKHGGTEVPVDVVVFATGFKQAANIVNRNVVDLRYDRKGNDVPLYKYMFPIQARSSSLALINFVQSATFMCADLQTRLFVRVLLGQVKLPSLVKQREEMMSERGALCARYLDRPQLRVQGGLSLSYYDELARMIGCYPSPWQLLRERPTALFHAWLAPPSSMQYRLVGPNSLQRTESDIELSYNSRFWSHGNKGGPSNRGSIRGLIRALLNYVFLFFLVVCARIRGFDVGFHNRKLRDNMWYARTDTVPHSFEIEASL